MTKISVSRVHFPVTTLGPGQRVGLWVQGCSIRCPGCISRDTWDATGTAVPIGDLLTVLDGLTSGADGLTVSGGEPFDQPEALAAVLRHWRARSAGSTLVFTGYDHNVVSPWLDLNPGLIDAIISGPFRSDLPQTLALRGSDNQRLHVLSPLGAAFAEWERQVLPHDRRLDVMVDEDGDAWFAGIPARGDLARLRRNFAAAGHAVRMSDMAGAEYDG